jgi:hypothetical protein
MNPYLEQNDTWEDFHSGFITHARDVLNAEVGDNYLVKIEVRLYIHELSEEERRFLGRGDVSITRPGGERPDSSGGAGMLAAPMDLWLPAVDIQRESYLEIHDRRERRVVTVLELLSPSNKTPGADHDAYVGKRRSLLGSMTHLVEIDLRRGGTRPTPPELPACDYYALVSRYQDRPRVGLWPIRLREPLPTIPVPLAGSDPAVSLDLQSLLHRVYDAAGYGKYIYQESPQPPLPPDDAAWAEQFLPRKN